ncbi:MAG: GNAT family N-acetyltransferase [Actinomycetota bacterium]|nr:GNAT family N-acetyltransferase [Actinomycetota bacterium]
MQPVAAFVVREGAEPDIPQIVDLLEAVAAEGRWIARELPIDRQEVSQRLAGALASERVVHYVAVAHGEVVGHAAAEISGYGVADLGMSVARSWRRRGVGSALLDSAVGWARRVGAHKVALQLWPHNVAAHRLYEKFGFVQEGVLRRHYRRSNGELWDAVVMGLVLDEEAPGFPAGTADA